MCEKHVNWMGRKQAWLKQKVHSKHLFTRQKEVFATDEGKTCMVQVKKKPSHFATNSNFTINLPCCEIDTFKFKDTKRRFMQTKYPKRFESTRVVHKSKSRFVCIYNEYICCYPQCVFLLMEGASFLWWRVTGLCHKGMQCIKSILHWNLCLHLSNVVLHTVVQKQGCCYKNLRRQLLACRLKQQCPNDLCRMTKEGTEQAASMWTSRTNKTLWPRKRWWYIAL